MMAEEKSRLVAELVQGLKDSHFCLHSEDWGGIRADLAIIKEEIHALQAYKERLTKLESAGRAAWAGLIMVAIPVFGILVSLLLGWIKR